MKNVFITFQVIAFLLIIIWGFGQKYEVFNKQIGPEEISYDTAHDMVQNFPGTYLPRRVGRRTINVKNTRAIWLDINKLDALIQQIKLEKGDGIRIYFAKYKSPHHQPDSHGKDQDYSSQNTIILVSTINKANHHVDYYDNIGAPFTNKIDKKHGFIFTPPANKGELTPPGDESDASLLNP